MKIPNYKNNFFKYEGNTEPALKFLKDAYEEVEKVLLEDAPRAMGYFDDFIKGIENKTLVFTEGKTYRLFTELAEYSIARGAKGVVNMCDGCGEAYFTKSENFKKTLKGITSADYFPFLGEDDGKYYCAGCREFDPQDGGRRLYIPVADRVKIEAEIFNCNGEKQRGKVCAYWNRRKRKGNLFFIGTADDNGSTVRTLFLKNNNFIIKPLTGSVPVQGKKNVYKRAISDPCNWVLSKNKGYYGISPMILREIEKRAQNSEEGFYKDYKYVKGPDFLEIIILQSASVIDKDGNHVYLHGEEAYNFLTKGYKICGCCGVYTSADSDQVLHREQINDEIDSSAFYPSTSYHNLCKACIDRNKKDPYQIHSYGTRFDDVTRNDKCFTSTKIFKINKDTIFYGVELEANTRGDREEVTREVLKRLGGYVFAKHDGSLDEEYGVEFVSVPADFHKTREIWSNLFNKKYARSEEEDKSCKELSAYSDNRCGLHIHISKSALNDKDICNIVFFINKYKNFCAKIAGRNYFDNRYTGVKNIRTESKDTLKIADACRCSSNGHYDAVNVQNSQTLEIRIFKANVTMSAFFRYLEFTDALVNYSKSLKFLDFSKVNPADFMEYCAGKNRYGFLNAFYDKNKEFFKKEKIEGLKIKKEMIIL